MSNLNKNPAYYGKGRPPAAPLNMSAQLMPNALYDINVLLSCYFLGRILARKYDAKGIGHFLPVIRFASIASFR